MTEKQQYIDTIEALHLADPEVRTEEETALLKVIIDLDQANKVQFLDIFEATKLKLQEMRANRKAHHTYRDPYDLSREEGIFYDKK